MHCGESQSDSEGDGSSGHTKDVGTGPPQAFMEPPPPRQYCVPMSPFPKEASAGKICMEALERNYQRYDKDNSGTLERPEIDAFFAEKLPGVSTQCVRTFFASSASKITFSKFLKLLYVAMGGHMDGMTTQRPSSRPTEGQAPETTRLWREFSDTWKVLEVDFEVLPPPQLCMR